MLLEEGEPPLLQGWAVVDNTEEGSVFRAVVNRGIPTVEFQEDRLEAIGREMERVTREKKETQAEVNRKLQELVFTKDLGTPSP